MTSWEEVVSSCGPAWEEPYSPLNDNPSDFYNFGYLLWSTCNWYNFIYSEFLEQVCAHFYDTVANSFDVLIDMHSLDSEGCDFGVPCGLA